MYNNLTIDCERDFFKDMISHPCVATTYTNFRVRSIVSNILFTKIQTILLDQYCDFLCKMVKICSAVSNVIECLTSTVKEPTLNFGGTFCLNGSRELDNFQKFLF